MAPIVQDSTTIDQLRQLVEFQQFDKLYAEADKLWSESQSPAALPLLALALVQKSETVQDPRVQQAILSVDTLDELAQVDLAAVFISLGRIIEAQQLLQALDPSAKNNSVYLTRMGTCCLAQGDTQQAIQWLEQAARIDDSRISVKINLIAAEIHSGHFETAQQSIVRTSEALDNPQIAYPADVISRYRDMLHGLQVRLWVITNQFAQAESWIETLAAQKETHLFWLLGYADQLARCDHQEQASYFLRDHLGRYKGNRELHLKLAALEQLLGHQLSAQRLIQGALKENPDDVGLWVRLAQLNIHTATDEAREAAEKAKQLAQSAETTELALLASVSSVLAEVESWDGHTEQAESLYREALNVMPGFTPALRGLGQMKLQAGEIDEAITLFEQISAFDPITSYTSLITARQFPEDTETLHRLERAAKMPSLEGSLSSDLLFQIAAAWEKKDDYEKAFSLAQAANTHAHQLLSYDPVAHRQNCYHIRMRYSKALFEHRSACGVGSHVPVYVVGMPRSGTTLVEQIIGSHSQIFGAGELGLIPRVIQGLNRWERIIGSARQYPDCMDDLTAETTAGIANNLLESLREYAPEAKHIVDKLPHNFENIGLIKFLFPNAKIISVRRDPRDIAISNYFTHYQARHGGMGFAYDLTHIGEQLADHNLLMHHWDQLFPGQILDVHYEQLISDPEACSRKMLDYIGVEWEPGVLGFQTLDRPVKTASAWQVRQPIYQSSKARWEHYQDHLTPLIRGTNAKIRPESHDMLSLPEPGFYHEGVNLFTEGNLDAAELSFKKMLQHNPDHASCLYMVGLIYLHKNDLNDGIEMIEQALEKAPWRVEWSENLIRAYRALGNNDEVRTLEDQYPNRECRFKISAGSDKANSWMTNLLRQDTENEAELALDWYFQDG